MISCKVKFHLKDDVDKNGEEGKCELKYEPDFYRFDIRGGGETGGH